MRPPPEPPQGQFFDELGDAELSTVSNAASQPNLGEGSGDEIPKRREAPLEHISSAASHAHVSGPEHFERDRCGADEISDLVREETEAFVVASGFGIEQGLVAPSELRDGARDRVIETSIQGAEVVDADRRIQLEGEVGDGLTHIPIVVHDLRHRESLKVEIVAMAPGACIDLRVRRQTMPQGVDELIEESRDPVFEFRWRQGRTRPPLQLRPAAADDLFAVFGNKLKKHAVLQLSSAFRRGTETARPESHRAGAAAIQTRELETTLWETDGCLRQFVENRGASPLYVRPVEPAVSLWTVERGVPVLRPAALD